MMDYTPEQTEFAERHLSLGAEYADANEAAERFLAHWKEEHAEKLAEEIMKPVMDAVTDKVWDAFRDHILSDTEMNISGYMRDMVEKSVRALIGGQKWANVKYISPEGYQTEEVRKTLAKMYSDEIKDARIADLERELEQVKERLEWERRR